MLEELKKAGTIAIRPHCDPTKPNMGLEEYMYVVFPGTNQREPMACVESNGKIRYMNGLNEFAPEVKGMKDLEAKKAKIREIRKIVADLEMEKNYNQIDIEDENFWGKVETFRPDNVDLWSGISITCNNDPIFLDPVNKSDDLLVVLAIEAGGFPLVAKSLEDVRNGRGNRKWYLDKQVETAGSKVSVGRAKNKALAVLETLSGEKPRKLFFIAKLIDTNSMFYKNDTLPDVIYNNMDTFISGGAWEPNIKKAAAIFTDYADMSMEDLIIKTIVKDATFYKYLNTKGDGMIYTNPDNELVGRKPQEAFEFLKNPLNEDVLERLKEKVEQNW